MTNINETLKFGLYPIYNNNKILRRHAFQYYFVHKLCRAG